MKVLIAGDYCPQNRVADLFEKRDFESVLGNVRDLISTVDYSIVNFECPVCDGSETPIVKFGPNLKCTEHGVEALKWAGFKCVTLANNHFLDYGEEGVAKTLKTCQDYGIDTVGGGVSLSEASQVLYKKIDGRILAIINCCEHEFSIATETTAGSNPLNPIHQFYAIQEARAKSDNVIVIVHGGHEQYQLPSPRMVDTYRFFVDAGADAVINHHQHCYSGYETYKGKPIFYGIGNFCFDIKAPMPKGWAYGYMVQINFQPEKIVTRLYPYSQCVEKIGVKILCDNAFDKQIETFNKIIADYHLLLEQTRFYYDSSMQSIALSVDPIQNRIIGALQYRHVLPLSYSKRWLIKLQNLILCEAHRDKMNYFLKNFHK